MNHGNFLRRTARYFLITHFFATLWTVIGIAALVVAGSMLRKALFTLDEAHEMYNYLHQPFEVKIQLHGTSSWLDMITTGKAVIAPQENTTTEQEISAPEPESSTPMQE